MKALVYLLSLLILFCLILFVLGFYRQVQTADKILKTERVLKDGESKYLIFGQKETYEDTDSIVFFKFNSSDIYGKIQVGQTCVLTVYGWRFPLASTYRNIIKADCKK